MKLEVGKFYRSKLGEKIRIYALDGSNGLYFHYAIFREVDGWQVAFYPIEMAKNIIAGEWVEPSDPWDAPEFAIKRLGRS